MQKVLIKAFMVLCCVSMISLCVAAARLGRWVIPHQSSLSMHGSDNRVHVFEEHDGQWVYVDGPGATHRALSVECGYGPAIQRNKYGCFVQVEPPEQNQVEVLVEDSLGQPVFVVNTAGRSMSSRDIRAHQIQQKPQGKELVVISDDRSRDYDIINLVACALMHKTFDYQSYQVVACNTDMRMTTICRRYSILQSLCNNPNTISWKQFVLNHVDADSYVCGRLAPGKIAFWQGIQIECAKSNSLRFKTK